MAPGSAPDVVRFGAFEFDLVTQELRKGRTKLRVPDQSLAILAMLLERPGKLVTRDAIQARLWPNGTIVEFDHSMNAAVKRLREVLSDTASSPRFIETLPRRGYRFIASVQHPLPISPIPHYRILAEIGRGAMGIVYKAEDSRLGREVALKVLPPELATDPQRKARLIREAQAASALNHTNIVTVHDVGSQDGRDFIVMEFVEGKPLNHLISNQGMPVEEAVRIAGQVAAGLAAAHGAGIIHRDLKPGNIRVTADGRVKLLDFGLAKFIDPPPLLESTSDGDGARTVEGELLGTVDYMSPEQAEGKPADARSDIFSFGAVLFEMLTGRKAFERESPAATLAAILREDPPAIGHFVPGIPPALEAVVAKALRKEPFDRYQSMEEVREALAPIERGMETGRPPIVRSFYRRWRWPAAAALAALAAGAIGWYWWQHVQGPRMDLQPVVLTPSPGAPTHPSFSPDGGRVVFAWTRVSEDNPDILDKTSFLYVQQIGTGTPPVRLTGENSGQASGFGMAEESPAWSPDDRYVAFVRVGDKKSAIFLIPPMGGPERKVAEFSSGVLGDQLAWTPDAKWLAAPIAETAHGPQSIWLISVETGEPRRITKAPAPTRGDGSPAVAPDGRSLAFIRRLKDYVAAPYVEQLSSKFEPEGEPRELASQHFPGADGIAWTGDSRAIVYSAAPGLLWLAASGGKPVRLPFAAPVTMHPAIDAKHARLIWTWFTPNNSLWRMDTRTHERKMLFGSSWNVLQPQYSPNGRKIAFLATASADSGVWTCDADGSNCLELAALGVVTGGTPAWSPDGKWVAFDSRAEGQSAIYVVPADGGGARRVSKGSSDDMVPSWSRDGRWIYFGSDRTGRVEIWKMPFPGGLPVQVTHHGGFYALESADGANLYYVSQPQYPQGSALYRVPVKGGREELVTPAVANWHAFSVTSRSVYFSPDARAIQRLDLASGVTSNVTVTEKLGTGDICASADDAFIVWSQYDRMRLELMMVEGFR